MSANYNQVPDQQLLVKQGQPGTQDGTPVLLQALPQELQALQRANKFTTLSHIYLDLCCFCLSRRAPQFYYTLKVDDTKLGHIMHGRQEFEQVCCACSIQCCPGGMRRRSGGDLCAGCKRCCSSLRECCAEVCGGCCGWTETVQDFNFYENAIEAVHTVTPIGQSQSLKDGFYVGRQELSVGAFYDFTEGPILDDLYAVNNDGVDIKGNQVATSGDFEVKFKPPGGAAAGSGGFLGGLLGFGAKHRQQLIKAYSIFYKGSYLGRYLHGSKNHGCRTVCCVPCFGPGKAGYTYLIDLFLLDNADNLLYRIEQEEIPFKEALCGHGAFAKACRVNPWDYRFKITNADGEEIGSATYYHQTNSSGFPEYRFEVELRREIAPMHKLLLTYLHPFLNEWRFNAWGRDLDGHNNEGIENNVDFSKPYQALEEIIYERLTDKMNFNGVNMRDIPKVLEQTQNAFPTKKEAKQKKIKSYQGSKALTEKALSL